MTDNGRILIGKISGCFGIKGWVKVFSYSNPRENICTYKDWLIDGTLFKSVQSKKHGKNIVAKLKDVDSIEEAQMFIGQKIEITEQQLPKLKNDEYYWNDLIGLDVSNTNGISFGEIVNLMETGVNDVLIVKGNRERLIPFLIPETVLNVDLENKTMLVDWHEDD
ncbi:MAG TPA: ribosome maturation factor RimM [Gammaproteobacteria bacterium]|jgi:16S rRNA processing protein RimM|nr:ribosome maturation factor RimM [Xanthomonadales bacterium]HOP23116.1 ribosome maturation factor RimM [Gammaproteobacteria bacterium]MCB1593875.1 ribosome maturation factor RimM [Xanthomonadales bacterium]MCB1603092.1 ribosome maturation factor RimM [Xanthomonadales bacterium]HPI96812.1 ribosome maturation factor RimM [Gammaproteobacteria bacterium]